ncbi:holliday junction resolvase [Gordonia phage Lozinak]|uniref:Holliday junction resolvase n=5 Tax=Smoothievirus TaxID=1982557 RepID=A0A2D1GFX2_9CAUD|nr:endonuclease VII [Gordonia phage Smoothie]YP_009273076.1 endonuclease VII [Gordonia phage ClubL]YP_009276154.1 endonuclease VII [Gordonia phage Bachita]YP_009281197.1 endonuclease VII [Gordonia phage Cucurbita]ATN90667.1 holliday junction resolvase [Gordonia phage Lozinak]AUE23678.1 holliday junction resolvase [Gordonia phage Toniann]QAU06906.1 holliday junction resolvase [Gordonia phage Aphelion]QKY79619.1 endonuclease VII [Gordonia Phage Engineer]QYC53526.1 endonuclease VII [Gordonia p
MSRAKERTCALCDQAYRRTSREQSLRLCQDCDGAYARCISCDTWKSTDHFNSHKARRNGLDNKCKECDADRKLRARYGISFAEYAEQLLEQGGKCAICGTAPDDGSKLHVDHCHTTGKKRGLLCSQCNTAIGLLKEDLNLLSRAADYLELFS